MKLTKQIPQEEKYIEMCHKLPSDIDITLGYDVANDWLLNTTSISYPNNESLIYFNDINLNLLNYNIILLYYFIMSLM